MRSHCMWQYFKNCIIGRNKSALIEDLSPNITVHRVIIAINRALIEDLLVVNHGLSVYYTYLHT